MKLGAVPENFVERLAFRFGLLPPGIVESWFGIMVARTMMAATKLDIFEALTEEEWGVYQRGMRSGSEMHADWIAQRLPVPRAARTMLDVGGAHGYFSVAICRRHPRLRATVLDLPEAIRHAAPLLAEEGM